MTHVGSHPYPYRDLRDSRKRSEYHPDHKAAYLAGRYSHGNNPYERFSLDWEAWEIGREDDTYNQDTDWS